MSAASAWQTNTMEVNRLASDGISSFLWRQIGDGHGTRSVRVASFGEPMMIDELQAFSIRDDASRAGGRDRPSEAADFLVVQRRNAATSLPTPQGIVHLTQNVWRSHPYQYDFALDDLIEREWGDRAFTDLGRKLSRLAVHLLSPKGIGGTLILLADDVPQDSELFDSGRQSISRRMMRTRSR